MALTLKLHRIPSFIKKSVLPVFILFLSFNAFSLSFSIGVHEDNVFFDSERLTIASDGTAFLETEPFKVPVFFGLGFSARFIQRDVNKDTYYFSKNYDDLYFNKGFSFYSGYAFTFPINDTFFIQTQPALFYKYSTTEFFKQIISLSGKQRLVQETLHQMGVYLPLTLGTHIKHFDIMFRLTAIYIPVYYLDDDYYIINNGRYVISFSDSNFKYNSFGYFFGFLVKYTL